ncbi:hypothetical protein Pelo_15462 [Pelomyxa schiedti]|nr:hypothetical protein Pelo_15462 [Pelomyxa schiedti]
MFVLEFCCKPADIEMDHRGIFLTPWFAHPQPCLCQGVRSGTCQAEHIKLNQNLVLSKMLSRNKIGCCEWLIDNCCLALPDLFQAVPARPGESDITLPTWRFLLRKFPAIDSDAIMQIMNHTSNQPNSEQRNVTHNKLH